jgi:hypothetical protein
MVARLSEPTIITEADIDPGHNWRKALQAPGVMAVDFEERINFQRLHRYRLARTRQALKNSELGAILCFDANNIRYMTVARADSAMVVLTAAGTNLDAATTSLRSVLARMDAGEGTLGRLSTDDALYVNLNSAAESMATLLEDLRANPNRYINISIF